MPTWGWVLIAIGAVAVVALVVRLALAQRRTDRLRVDSARSTTAPWTTDSKRKAEADLAAREERREELQIRTLSPGARDRYVERWQVVQAQFVDDPRAAVASADSLIQAVMQERGYPVEDFEQRAADVSVDHPEVVENYRQGHQLAEASAEGQRLDRGSTAGHAPLPGTL